MGLPCVCGLISGRLDAQSIYNLRYAADGARVLLGKLNLVVKADRSSLASLRLAALVLFLAAAADDGWAIWLVIGGE
jgi:hypothetical protein